jgi:predicted phage-related endonuclease
MLRRIAVIRQIAYFGITYAEEKQPFIDIAKLKTEFPDVYAKVVTTQQKPGHRVFRAKPSHSLMRREGA